MKARSTAVIAADGVLSQVASEPPLTIRRVRDDDPAMAALCLIGTAAGPLPGDHLELDLVLEADAHASLRAAGAMLAQGRGGTPAVVRTTVRLDEHASLDADPGPLIVSAGAVVDVDLHIDVAHTATLRWRELVVLGRTGEAGGQAKLHWHVDRDRRPLLRQTVTLEPQERWPGILDGRRVLLTELHVGPEVEARTVVHDGHAITQRLAANAVLTTVLAEDAVAADKALQSLLS